MIVTFKLKTSSNEIVVFFLLISMNYSHAQQTNCTVKMKEIQGTYEGDCKDGKASGKGNAIGEDTYEGNFKNGYPDGTGKYIG